MLGIKRRIGKLKRLVDVILFSETYPLVRDLHEKYPVVYHIKDDTWEPVYSSETYRINKGGVTLFFHPKQAVLLVRNASVTAASDIIVTTEGVIWDKAYFENFTKVIPLDSNLVKYNKEQVTILKKRKKNYIHSNCISLLGVHDRIWAHFIVQFLEKLYYAIDAGLFDKELVILVPVYSDSHLKKIVDDIVSSYPKVSLVQVDSKTEYVCDSLFYIPTATIISNHAEYEMTADCVVPELVLQKLKNNLVNYYSEKARKIPVTNDKIYLVRRGTYRAMTNYAEAEEYFQSQGFTLVEPHKISLEEKVALFNNARIIVGPFSSAFSNIIFCQKRAKLLVFSSMIRTIEPYLPALGHVSDVDMMLVTGDDISSNIHTAYNINISRIEEAYNQLLNE